MSGVRLTMTLTYGPKREMTVCQAGGNVCYSKESRTIEKLPELRLRNRYLLEAGFAVGSKVNVEYGNGVVTITKVNPQHHDYQLQKSPCPQPHPVSAAAEPITA